ncbi:MAG: glycosyltransferase [Acidimicrobiales bacterium]
MRTPIAPQTTTLPDLTRLSDTAVPGPSTDNERDSDASGSSPTAELTILVPTRNESPAIELFLERLAKAVRQPASVLFIDDSDDGTPHTVRRLVERRPWGSLDVGLLHRPPGHRNGGLGSAVVEGLKAATTDWVVVMDADLQHPPEAITRLVDAVQDGQADLVVASRFTQLEAISSDSLSPARQRVTQACLAATHIAFPKRLAGVTDPLSGFFMLRRKAVDPDMLQPDGFKILLEILGRFPRLRVREIGFRFDDRSAGTSKASLREGARFARQLARLRTRSRINRVLQRHQFRYAIHDLLTIESDTDLPELAKFRVRTHGGPPDLRVTAVDSFTNGDAALVQMAETVPEIRYQESVGRSGFGIQVTVGETTEIEVSAVVGHSPHVLYTNVVEPIIRWKLVETGHALVHAACFTTGDAAHLITARTDTGKTTTMLKVLDHSECEFISDDLCLIDANGRVRPYPKPLTISNHTVHALTGAELGRLERFTLPIQSRLHSKAGRQFAFLIAGHNFPVATLNAVVQRLIPPPKYHVERLVPGVRTHVEATIESLFIIERGDAEQTRTLDPSEALPILLENCEDAYGFPPYEQLETLLHSISDLDLVRREREIIASALEQVPAKLLTSAVMGWAETILDTVCAGDPPVAEEHG